jgi:GntR family transcriptional repressor for pyruvate dehydrogenase complex
MKESTLYRHVRSGKGALPQQVAHQIVDLITSRQLEVGRRLPPLDELAECLGVSRGAVREATKLLEAWGVVTAKHGVGTFVSKVGEDALMTPIKVSAERSDETFRDLHQIREALEPYMASVAAESAKPEHIEEMEQALRSMEETLGRPVENVEADLAFHSALARATGNDLFLIVLHPVIDLMQDMRLLTQRTPAANRRTVAVHRAILDHVKAGRAGEAREAMQSHLDHVWRVIQSQLIEKD